MLKFALAFVKVVDLFQSTLSTFFKSSWQPYLFDCKP